MFRRGFAGVAGRSVHQKDRWVRDAAAVRVDRGVFFGTRASLGTSTKDFRSSTVAALAGLTAAVLADPAGSQRQTKRTALNRDTPFDDESNCQGMNSLTDGRGANLEHASELTGPEQV
jgi:hypothetical protein